MLERQIQVFQILLGGRQQHGGAQFRRQLALLVDALDDGLAPGFKRAQIVQSERQFAQLNVVQPAGGFLAVARNEGHGGSAVDEVHGGLDLVHANPDFLRDLRNDVLHLWLCSPLGRLSGGLKKAGRVCHTPLAKPCARVDAVGANTFLLQA